MDKEQITVSVRQLMDKMTLSEKIGQLNQTEVLSMGPKRLVLTLAIRN